MMFGLQASIWTWTAATWWSFQRSPARSHDARSTSPGHARPSRHDARTTTKGLWQTTVRPKLRATTTGNGTPRDGSPSTAGNGSTPAWTWSTRNGSAGSTTRRYGSRRSTRSTTTRHGTTPSRHGKHCLNQIHTVKNHSIFSPLHLSALQFNNCLLKICWKSW